jgi:superfamily II DNA or RNA helicase
VVHDLIQNAARTWAHAPDCPLRAQLEYMRRRGGLRPVQIDAVETYLFLKVACGNKPLRNIFAEGILNTIKVDDLRVSQAVRDHLASHPDALALLQFASQPVAGGRGVLAPALRARLEDEPQSIDATAVFRDLFYGVPYTDYLFSLPMGAGKTFLMAAFIYLDLAFALQEPANPAFARNFLVLAPSGLKSSIVPSLRTIQAFDPSWVVAEPLASRLRRRLRFMVLDADSSASRSNRVRNPNVQKLASLQPFDELAGLVAVTNAEKVILDRLDDDQPELFDRTEDEKAAAANELRATIARIPALSVFIDEAHHTPARNQASRQSKEAASEVKLRRVVSQWAARDSVRTVLGFSGTPFLPSPERIEAAPGLEIKTAEIANTVHYFPLVDGVGAFLKKPVVQIVRDAPDSLDIVERGITEFFARFRDKRYSSGACAKLAIYCGTIERLETKIMPLAVRLCEANGLDPAASILRYHRGDRAYPAPEGAELAFAALDSAHSAVRIVLLVQIGKEGWDCRSLAGVVLSQEGDCPTNMVLQTSCRCLREVDRGTPEEAVVVLNEGNGRQLADQLKKQQHATLDEFQRGADAPVRLERFDRTKVLRLPDLPFYQLRVSYGAEIVEDSETPAVRLRALLDALPLLRRRTEVATGTFDDLRSGGVAEGSTAHYGLVRGDTPSRPFRAWLDLMQKESFGFWRPDALAAPEEKLLRAIHREISYSDASGAVFLSSEYDQPAIRARATAAFWPRRRLSTREETVPETARLLHVENLVSPIEVPPAAVPAFVPDQPECRRIVEADRTGSAGEAASGRVADLERRLAEAETEGDAELATIYRRRLAVARTSRAAADRSYHYLPYRTASAFERTFFEEALRRAELAERDLEIYYNGDSSLTEFRIHCYRRLSGDEGGAWTSVGQYTPDFLVLHRDKAAGAIDACLIVETKGELYARDPAFRHRRAFAAGEFLRLNAPRPGAPRFQYLYLEETADWQHQFVDAVKEFFK